MVASPEPAEEREFLSTVDNLVLGAIDAGCTDFGSLAASLPGVYPLDVLNSLNRQGLRESILFTQRPRSLGDPLDRMLIDLPVPHPLDYDWRFAAGAAHTILRACQRFAGDMERVLLLGTPSLVPVLRSNGFQGRLTVRDLDSSLIKYLNRAYPDVVIHEALGEPNPDLDQHDVVIADPPWYPEYMTRFLDLSATALKVGGILALSCPPSGTRAGVSQEMDRLTSYAEHIGFALVHVAPSMLPYVSPLFEVNALGASRVPPVPSQWRRGDLVVLRLARKVFPSEVHELTCQSECWEEVVVGDVRVRVRKGDTSSDDSVPALSSIVPGDILPSVSRRDPR